MRIKYGKYVSYIKWDVFPNIISIFDGIETKNRNITLWSCDFNGHTHILKSYHYDDSDVVHSIQLYGNGSQDSSYTYKMINKIEWWYESGKIKSYPYYRDIVYNGEYKSWFKNGQLNIECNYKDDLLDGKYVEYYRNGRIKIEANYVHNKLEGEYKRYNTLGECKISYYKDGKKLSLKEV